MYVRTRCEFIYTAFIPNVILAKDRRMVHHSHPSQPRKCLSMPPTGLSHYSKDACQASYTAAIMAPSTCPSTTRTRSRTTQSPDRLGAWGIPTTTHSPKQSTGCAPPSSYPQGPWTSLDHVELAAAQWVHWATRSASTKPSPTTPHKKQKTYTLTTTPQPPLEHRSKTEPRTLHHPSRTLTQLQRIVPLEHNSDCFPIVTASIRPGAQHSDGRNNICGCCRFPASGVGAVKAEEPEGADAAGARRWVSLTLLSRPWDDGSKWSQGARLLVPERTERRSADECKDDTPVPCQDGAGDRY